MNKDLTPWVDRCILRLIPNIIYDLHKERRSLKTTYKKSRQRERIYELLRGTETHPTASWIYDQLKGEFPDLSMGTVYRNLNILIEQDLIRKIDFGSTFDRFDANTEPHYHFICERCGSIADLELPMDYSLHGKVESSTGLKVKRHRIEFYGICKRCEVK
jgi:Fur family peroxide stress response transcriptional regulator